MKILLVGGGTGGSVSPLLAVREQLLKVKPDIQFIFFGTYRGPEKKMLEGSGIPYYPIPAGKWRRYFSFKNFFDIFIMFFGFFKALWLVGRLRPDLMFAAGSFVSVPVAYACFFRKVKVVVHQQDYLPTLSNKLVAPISSRITVSLEKSLRDFSQGSGLFAPKEPKTVLTGNPVREEIIKGNLAAARKLFGLKSDLPTLLVLGGSSGAGSLNRLIMLALPGLTRFFQVIHVTGKNIRGNHSRYDHYYPYEFLGSEMPHALKAADLVISRAGFSTITELAVCKKASIIIPLPESHQIYNAHLLWRLRAAIVVPEYLLTPELLVEQLRKLLFEHEALKSLQAAIGRLMNRDGAKKVAEVLLAVAYQS